MGILHDFKCSSHAENNAESDVQRMNCLSKHGLRVKVGNFKPSVVGEPIEVNPPAVRQPESVIIKFGGNVLGVLVSISVTIEHISG